MLRRYDQIHPYPIVLVRRAGDEHRPEAIVAMLNRCAEIDPALRFTRHRADDMTWAIDKVDLEWLRKTMELVEEPMDRLVGRLALMTAQDEPVKLVYWRELRWRPFRYELVAIDVPWAPKRGDRPVLQTHNQLMDLMCEAATAFGADVAGIYPRSLHALVRLASGEKTGGRGAPENGGGSTQGSSLPAFVSRLPEGLFERFTTLLPARAFDVAAVPEAVWWGNVWSREVVERIGRDRIEALPWARIEAAGSGGLLLQACKQRPAPNKPEELAAIASLLEELDLPRHQRDVRPG